VRTRIIDDFDAAFEKVDAILAPTSPFPAFGIGEKSDDVLAMYAADVFVSPAAIAGIPGLSVPVGKTAKGLPVGLQVLGARLGDETVLHIGHTVEAVCRT
jgi:aspartyl-tRNA(Asn)/glutamyl-tRNA(Gln) amidotransferase subunit A